MTQPSVSQSVTTITPLDAQTRLQTGEFVLIDVRTGVEYAGVHAVGAEHHPLDSLDVKSIVSRYPGKTIGCICKAGSRGAKAAALFLAAGCPRVANVLGGTDAWIAAGLPVERRNVMSLERQVRIAAGMIVLIGAILTWFVSPYFIAICAFVGAGLTFAGITDFCGMGLLLARMPWNRNLTNPSCNR